MKLCSFAAALVAAFLAVSVVTGQITVPNTFIAGTTISSTQVNSNFSTLGTNALNRTNGVMTGPLSTLGLTPTVDGGSDLGSSSFRYNNLWVKGTTQFNSLTYTWPSLAAVAGAVPRNNGSGTITWQPTAAATVTSFLKNDGSGTLSWSPTQATLTTTATGTVNDWAPGIQAGDNVIRCNNATLLTINGIAGGTAGQRLRIYSAPGSTGQVDLAPQNAGSSAANRFQNFATVGNTSLAPGTGFADYIYDGTASRWLLVAHEQGAWITPAFSAANFSNNNLSAWTVASGNVITNAYRLTGRTLFVSIQLANTTVGTGATALRENLFGGYTIAKSMITPCWISDNGTSSIGVFSTSTTFPNTLEFYHVNLATSWAVATTASGVSCSAAFEVQ